MLGKGLLSKKNCEEESDWIRVSGKGEESEQDQFFKMDFFRIILEHQSSYLPPVTLMQNLRAEKVVTWKKLSQSYI